MSTQHPEIDKDQAASPGFPGPFYPENTSQREKTPLVKNLPPPQRSSHGKRRYWFAAIAVIAALALTFSVFALAVSFQRQHSQVTLTPTTARTTITVSPGSNTPTQSVTQGPQNGPPSVNDPAYWDHILGTSGTNGKVESVRFANVLSNPTLQALVTVRHSDANSTLDIYIFDKAVSAHPTQLFKLTALIKGQAKISYYNSILTAQVNQNSALNMGKPARQWMPDLFREFAWNGGSMSQVAFPGFFPDQTRYQAEADQASVNQGHQPWRNDPTLVAKTLETQFFDWQRTVTTKLLSGGGPHDVSARVEVQEASIEGSTPSITVTLSRLEGNTHNMWIATSVADGTALTLKSPVSQQLLTSPVTFEGTGVAFEAAIGQAVVYDHLYTEIGHAQIIGTNGMGAGTYNTRVGYVASFPGIQEGIVAVYKNNGGLSTENVTAVMVKVLISG